MLCVEINVLHPIEYSNGFGPSLNSMKDKWLNNFAPKTGQGFLLLGHLAKPQYIQLY